MRRSTPCMSVVKLEVPAVSLASRLSDSHQTFYFFTFFQMKLKRKHVELQKLVADFAAIKKSQASCFPLFPVFELS